MGIVKGAADLDATTLAHDLASMRVVRRFAFSLFVNSTTFEKEGDI
jgi:hypothetical protein